MEKFYVIYDAGNYYNPKNRLEIFDSIEEACDYIENKLSQEEFYGKTIDNFKLICGTELKLINRRKR